jgi:class 3 adenylate cyclase/tetratricopeptide (TPR) repeat protein
LPVGESIELATILLTDLVGSTRLGNSVGPVRADQLREEHFELLRDAIAPSDGREVKNTGDGLMVAFSSASAAVRCAVAMQQLFERRYRNAEQALHVRIGLGAGESTVKDGDFFGAPTIEAARLCALAPSDGILVSGLTKSLAGRCEGVEFSSVGELELKGFPEPVEAFSVSWEPLGEEAGEPSSRWPLPPVLRSVPPVKYVGRVVERAALEEAMKLVRAGQRQVVLLSGEPGIGKTRLASYGAHSAHAEGFAVCWGACTEELAVPYEPWIGVCSQLVEHAPGELLAAHVGRHRGEVLRLARNLASRSETVPAPQPSDPETERYLLFNAVAGLLAEAAEILPLCVVLDDLHWADAQSLSLLKHVLRATEQQALQVIVTYRDSDLGKDHPLTGVLADMRSLAGVQRIALHGLGADEVAEIMTAVAGHELEPDGIELAAQIAAETDGNPFFVGEILRGLSESGGLVFDEANSRWSIDTSAGIALPESVREVIERRVERLGAESLETLRGAAVIGREFDIELVATVVEMDEARVLDHLEAAVAASLLAESSDRVGRFRFAHALVNQTLYDGLGATRRARMHQRVAQTLEDLYGADPTEHLGELALHWRMAAVSVEKAKAGDYALRAGHRALEQLAPAEAVKYFADAVELSSANGRERAEALIGLGEAQRQTGDSAYRETLLEASSIASGLGDAELAADAALANSRGYTSAVGDRDEQRLEAIARALELDRPPDPARRAQLLALQAMELSWDPDLVRRKALAEEALTLARGVDDVAALAAVLQRAFYAVWAPETLGLRRHLAAELAECAAALGDPAIAVWGQQVLVHSSVEHGDMARARAAAAHGRVLADQLGQPALKWFARFQGAALELLHGDLAAAEPLAEEAFRLGQEAGQPDAGLIYGAQIFTARHYQGRGEEIIELLKQSADAFPGVAGFRAGLAAVLSWLGRGDEARPILDDAADDRFQQAGANSSTLDCLVQYADAAFLSRHARSAAMLYERFEPFTERVVWNGAYGRGHVRMYLGLLAATLEERQQADEHLRFACEFQEASDMPLWTARGQLGWAEALAARGDAPGARERATRALELSREHGYRVFEPHAAALAETGSVAGR